MKELKESRLHYQPKLPSILTKLDQLSASEVSTVELNSQAADELIKAFPKIHSQPLLRLSSGDAGQSKPLKVGAVFSGGQAAGGHNVLSGLYDALKKLHSGSQLYGFLGGPKGLFTKEYLEITQEIMNPYRNQGGFDLIGSGRDKIEKPEQFQATAKLIQELSLDGLVIIGGDDSNTNAAFLAEYFLQEDIDCRVVGVPKTIDGDLTNEYVSMSFGFDTACKTYSEIIGNIARDALSAGKYYFFIKLMGRSASHIALECALQTHPNMALIGEEVEAKRKTLKGIVADIADMICDRAERDLHHGVILIPEGIVEFIPEMKELISELNQILAHNGSVDELSSEAQSCYQTLPPGIQEQLLKDRDPHGNVQVSKIESDRLLLQLVKEELKRRGDAFKGKFSAQPYFCGYEGRSCFPTNFDANYCYALGHAAALLIKQEKTGYMASVTNLDQPPEEWGGQGVPLVPLMDREMRKGKLKLVVKKALVDLKGPIFEEFANRRDQWMLEDDYRYPGPIQFFGPQEITDRITSTLRLKSKVTAH